MDIQQIRCFLAVADELHFGRAAKRLHLTPSPLSRRIRELEHELGGDLFVREYHNVELTRLGREFCEPARDVVRRFDDLKRLGGSEASVPRRCRIGAAPLAAPQALEMVLDAFNKVALDVDLPITFAATAELLPKLSDGEIDLAVVHVPVGAAEIETLTVLRSGCSVVMRAGDELAGRESLTFGDLAGRRMLMMSQKIHPFFMAGMRRTLIEGGVTNIVDLPHNDAIQMGVQILHTGLLCLTLRGANHPAARIYSDPAFATVPLEEPAVSISAAVAWRRDPHWRVPAVDMVLDTLREQYAEHPMLL